MTMVQTVPWLLVFGTDPKRLPLDDVAGMQAALRRLLPGVEVENIFGWDWVADRTALGTWCIFRPGQLARLLAGASPHRRPAVSSRAQTRRSHGAASSTARLKAATAPRARSIAISLDEFAAGGCGVLSRFQSRTINFNLAQSK